MKHTQGPWSVITNNAYQTSWIIMDSNGNQLAQVVNYQNASRNVDAEENAKLMARAPELLERIAELEREKAQGDGIWQTMESAPRIGQILACGQNLGIPNNGYHIVITRYDGFGWESNVESDGEMGYYHYLTHWRKMPELPNL